MLRSLVTRDATGDERRNLVRHRDGARAQDANRLDGFAPFLVRHTEYDGLGDRGMGLERRLDLHRIDVLPAGLDQLLGRAASPVPEIAVAIESTVVAGMVPGVAEGCRRFVGAIPATVEHARSGTTISPVSPVGRGRSLSSTTATEIMRTGRPAEPGRSRNGAMVTKPDVSVWPKAT